MHIDSKLDVVKQDTAENAYFKKKLKEKISTLIVHRVILYKYVVDTVVKDDGERHRGLAELYK